jgi:hypothetical protein
LNQALPVLWQPASREAKGVELPYRSRDIFISGNKVVPCLIDRVTDATKMRDPRQEPGFLDVEIRIGDIAYFLLTDITKIDFTESLPPQFQSEYKHEGVYAYFRYVKKAENRRKLQERLRAWYESHQQKP